MIFLRRRSSFFDDDTPHSSKGELMRDAEREAIVNVLVIQPRRMGWKVGLSMDCPVREKREISQFVEPLLFALSMSHSRICS